jgi:hypothetical protein
MSLHKTYDITSNAALYDYWYYDKGVSSMVRFPFYVGNVSVGLTLSDYTAQKEHIPSYNALQTYTGWGFPLRFGPVEINNGILVANTIMRFEDSITSYRGERTETESSMSYVTDISVWIHKNIGIQAYYQYHYLYTFHRIKQHYIGVGVITEFKNSSKIQRALK